MADFRFKISGNTNPFFAELWNSDCSTLIQQKAIDYSGTCVVFGKLEASTCYNVKLSDRINYTISTGFTTPIGLTPVQIPVKCINLLGTVNSSSPNIQQIVAPKYVTINPALSTNQCVDLRFNTITCNVSNTMNQITLYCNNIALSPTYSNSGSLYKCINMKYGDNICYDITSYCNGSGNICGNTALNLTGVTGYGFNACIGGNNCISTSLSVTTTTTTTTTLTPVVVNVCRQYSISNQSSGYINVVPPLLGSQYVTLNYSINQLACTNQAVVHLFCKPNGGSNFMLKCSYCTNSINCIVCSNYYTGNIKIEPGDCVCYYNCLFGGGMSRYMLTSVAGSSGIIPTIGTGKNMDCLICS